MADTKLSAIAVSGSNLVAADQIVGVNAGTTDLLFSGTQIKAFTSASPTLVTPNIGTATGTGLIITSASATSLVSGLNGSTNPAFQVDASTASSATGLKVKSAAAAAGLALSVITSGTNENLTIDAAGSGTITLGGTSTGAIIHTRASTFSAAITYGGVTLTNAVTGTGAMVLSAAPAFTGTLTAAGIVATSNVQAGAALLLGFTGRGQFTSPAAGSMQFGIIDVDTNAAIVGQTIRSQGALAGGTSDQAGKDLTVIISPGKGTGIGGSLLVQTAPAGGSGTTVNTPITRLTIDSTGLATFGVGISNAGNTLYTAATSGPTLKQGANGRVGTFVANGTSTVTINNTSIATTDAIIISLNTPGGTVGFMPSIKTVTAATSFTVECSLGDTSTYNYALIKNAA